MLCLILYKYLVYSVCYVRSDLDILFHRVVPCTVFGEMYAVLLPPGVYPDAVNK